MPEQSITVDGLLVSYKNAHSLLKSLLYSAAICICVHKILGNHSFSTFLYV